MRVVQGVPGSDVDVAILHPRHVRHHQPDGRVSRPDPRRHGGDPHGQVHPHHTLHVHRQNARRKCVTTSALGSGGRAVERRTVNPGDGGSIPPTALSKLRQFRLPHICLYLSEETLQAGGPFYLVSMPGEVKDPTQGVNV